MSRTSDKEPNPKRKRTTELVQAITEHIHGTDTSAYARVRQARRALEEAKATLTLAIEKYAEELLMSKLEATLLTGERRFDVNASVGPAVDSGRIISRVADELGLQEASPTFQSRDKEITHYTLSPALVEHMDTVRRVTLARNGGLVE